MSQALWKFDSLAVPFPVRVEQKNNPVVAPFAIEEGCSDRYAESLAAFAADTTTLWPPNQPLLTLRKDARASINTSSRRFSPSVSAGLPALFMAETTLLPTPCQLQESINRCACSDSCQWFIPVLAKTLTSPIVMRSAGGLTGNECDLRTWFSPNAHRLRLQEVKVQ